MPSESRQDVIHFEYARGSLHNSGPQTAAPDTMNAVQEQKQINDLVEELELSVCIIRDPCSRRAASPHGDTQRRHYG
jgi:hypothetical protein